MGDNEPLLAGLRVLDLCDDCGGDADLVTRLLADLGADVLKVEPPAGSAARRAAPTLGAVSIPFALHNANKRATVLDPADDADRRRLIELAGSADIVVDRGHPDSPGGYGVSCEQLADLFPHLVAMSVTDFGAAGPRAAWRAGDPVLYAMSTALSRSGPTSGKPVLPPDGIASATAAVQATWAVLVAYFHRLRCGKGEFIDFSRFDAVVLALDPPFGTQGQAATARQHGQRWRGRPKNQDLYPIFRCRDGYVRLCVLSPRQWHGMRAWLGEPEQFQDPRFDTIAARVAAFDELGGLMAALFADRTMDELVAAGQAHGVPIAAVLTPAGALDSEHLRVTGALSEAELAGGVRVRIPAGYWVVDGRRAGYRTPAPAVGSAAPRWLGPRFDPPPTAEPGGRPLAGVRVVDLGIIVAGGELSRLFGDLGAEVVKVESAAYPDGLRQTRAGQLISESFVRAHRNHLSLGLEMRTPEGAALFERLVATADAVFANFKPGTLPSLGFSHQRLQELNPGLILAESSAFGDNGPWSGRMGYGPLVRAAIGVTRLWTSAEPDDRPARHPFYDATTVFPDHVVGRITAIGALAGLIRRARLGCGARIHVSQAEAVINQLDVGYVVLAARAEDADVIDLTEDLARHLVLPCLGVDEWIVVSLPSAAARQAAAAVAGRPAAASDAELADALSGWVRDRTPAQAAEMLQAAGVPAGPMNRAEDVHRDPQLRARRVLTELSHPLLESTLPCEAAPAPYRHIPPAAQRPAPLPGADTRWVCREVLTLPALQTERLIGDGVLFAAEDNSEGVPR